MSVLAILAFFFAMRSCEYLLVSGKERKTKPMCLRNINFLNSSGGSIPQKSKAIFSAHAVSITFEEQKNGEKWDRSTQDATVDPLLNPVRVAAELVSYL